MIIPSFDVASDVSIRVHHLTPNSDRGSRVVVMCHPTGFCALTFASVVAHFRNLNVFAIDLRSHGYSQRGDLDSWAGFGKDLEAAFGEIAKRTGQETFVGVGISSGSSAHILNAAKHSEIYDGLYLCEPILFPPGSNIEGRDMLAKSARNRRPEFESYDEAYFKYKRSGPLSTFSDSALALYCRHGFEKTSSGVTLRCNPKDEEAIYLSGIANGVYDALEKIKVPTVIAYGQSSKTVNNEIAKSICSKMENATVEEIRGTGHFTLFENPFLGAKLIAQFIESLPPKKLGV